MDENTKETNTYYGPQGGGAKQYNVTFSLFGNKPLECVQIICATIIIVFLFT